MRLLTVILTALMLLPALGHAQNMIAWPVDEAKKDPSFLTYRNAMLELVKAQGAKRF
jgi:hypothetical protein